MPTLNGNDSEAVVPMVRRFVQSKANWSDRWQLERYVEPIEARHNCAPQVGECDVGYRFGTIKREDSTAFVAQLDRSLNDRYVRVLIQQELSEPTPVWYGIAADTQSTLISSQAEGDQRYKCYELSHLLDRQQIRTSWVKPTKPSSGADDDEREVVEINRVVVFNEKTSGGALLGNRSADVSQEDDAETWFFDYALSLPWSNKDICEYLLKRLAPQEITWELTGETGPLEDTFEIWDFTGGQSVWDALNDLIKRERGLGFYLRIGGGEDGGDGDQTVEVVVYSISDVAISYGAYELPANNNQVFFALPGDTEAHLLSNIPFRNTATTQYDRIEIVGRRLLCVATWAIESDNLQRAWTVEKQASYNLGVGNDPEENDAFRAQDFFGAVYSRFVVTREWDCKNDDGDDGEFYVTIPRPEDDAEYDVEETGEFWNAYKRFEKDLPFLDGLGYNQEEISVNEEDYELDFRPLLAAVKWKGYADNVEDRWAELSRMSEVFEDLQNGHYRALDSELGIEIKFSPRHYVAKNHFDPETAGPSNHDPVVDYDTLFVTAAVEADDPPMIVLERQGGDPPEILKKLRIEVPGAEYWYVNPSTVVDVDSDGDRVIYLDGAAKENPVLRWLRKDKDKLEAVASFASAWYGPRRQPIQIPIKTLGVFVPLGAMLTDIRGAFGVEPIRTAVTSITWDFQSNLTMIATSYADLDYVGLMDDYFVTNEYYAEQLASAARKAYRGNVQSSARVQQLSNAILTTPGRLG